MSIKTIIKFFILFLIKKYPRAYQNILKTNKNKFIINYINSFCLECINNSFATKCYWFIHDIKTFPHCHYCKKQIKRNVININIGYSKHTSIDYIYCNSSCAQLDDHTQQLKQNNNYKKYGVKSTNSLLSVKNKKRQTWIENYGTDNPAKSSTIKQKISSTIKLEKQNNPNYFKEKQKKSRKTRLQKYGNPTYNNREKSTQTRLQKNNGKYFSDETIKLMSQTRQLGLSIGKYINSYKISGSKYRIITLSKSYDKIMSDKLYEPCFSKQFFIENQSTFFDFTWKCRIHNVLFNSPWKGGSHKMCPLCKENGISNSQKELYMFLHENTKNIIYMNNRSIIYPLELDLYIKENNFAIEFNGSYWHNDKDINYHINKTKMCEQKNIKLIHIWEHEWKDTNKQINIKNHILQQLNNESFIFQDDTIELDRCKFPINTNIPNYILINETPPIQHIINNFSYYDCGKLIFKKIN